MSATTSHSLSVCLSVYVIIVFHSTTVTCINLNITVYSTVIYFNTVAVIRKSHIACLMQSSLNITPLPLHWSFSFYISALWSIFVAIVDTPEAHVCVLKFVFVFYFVGT